jgi:hypothetical protein
VTEWTSPADIRAELQRLWDRGHILKARIDGTQLFPRALRLRRPDTAAMASRFDEVRQWIRTLQEGSKQARGCGYDITWKEINHRQLGRNRMPTGIRVDTEQDAFRLIGTRREAERFSALSECILRQFPPLRGWLASHPLTVLAHVDDWQRIIAVLTWFQDHPRAGLYLRQIDAPGVDTKFIESRRRLLAELLDLLLPPDAIDTRFTAGRGFEPRYGLATKPILIRFRLLDERLAIGGLCDLTVPAVDFASLRLDVRRVFITENEINGLAFPPQADSLVIFGLGYGLERLTEATWLSGTELHYWGDIDTHGFEILDRLRAVFPTVNSLLMDRATLLAHRASWVTEGKQFEGDLTRLSASERALFDELRTDVHGERVRLEQERIAFGWLRRALQAMCEETGR